MSRNLVTMRKMISAFNLSLFPYFSLSLSLSLSLSNARTDTLWYSAMEWYNMVLKLTGFVEPQCAPYTISSFEEHIVYLAYTKCGLGAKSQNLSSVAPPGRKTWLLFSVRDLSWGHRNPCFTQFSVVTFL